MMLNLDTKTFPGFKLALEATIAWRSLKPRAEPSLLGPGSPELIPDQTDFLSELQSAFQNWHTLKFFDRILQEPLRHSVQKVLDARQASLEQTGWKPSGDYHLAGGRVLVLEAPYFLEQLPHWDDWLWCRGQWLYIWVAPGDLALADELIAEHSHIRWLDQEVVIMRVCDISSPDLPERLLLEPELGRADEVYQLISESGSHFRNFRILLRMEQEDITISIQTFNQEPTEPIAWRLSQAEWEQFQVWLDRSGFWQAPLLPVIRPQGYMDATGWSIEGYRQGRYLSLKANEACDWEHTVRQLYQALMSLAHQPQHVPVGPQEHLRYPLQAWLCPMLLGESFHQWLEGNSQATDEWHQAKRLAEFSPDILNWDWLMQYLFHAGNAYFRPNWQPAPWELRQHDLIFFVFTPSCAEALAATLDLLAEHAPTPAARQKFEALAQTREAFSERYLGKVFGFSEAHNRLIQANGLELSFDASSLSLTEPLDLPLTLSSEAQCLNRQQLERLLDQLAQSPRLRLDWLESLRNTGYELTSPLLTWPETPDPLVRATVCREQLLQEQVLPFLEAFRDPDRPLTASGQQDLQAECFVTIEGREWPVWTVHQLLGWGIKHLPASYPPQRGLRQGYSPIFESGPLALCFDIYGLHLLGDRQLLSDPEHHAFWPWAVLQKLDTASFRLQLKLTTAICVDSQP